MAESFYREYKDRNYFSTLIDFITSRPVMMFLVQGRNAVAKVRRIIGKRDSSYGLRRHYAESIVRNVAHGADSLNAAKREINLIFGGKECIQMKTIFALGGLSESGKSTTGRYLDSKGVARWKFMDFYREIMKENDLYPGLSFDEWQDKVIKSKPQWLWKHFIEALIKKMQQNSINYCVLESLYDPTLAKALKEEFSEKAVVVYINIPQKIRLRRQIIRQGLSNIKEAKEYLIPRDKDKIKWGGLRIKEIADVIIDNSGSIKDLYNQIDKMLEKYCPELMLK